MNLVIIEGAGKVKKISEILGNEYKVFATCGHITQLNENINNGYGFEFAGPNAFEPKFQTLGLGTKESKASVIKALKELASKADKIYLATDPDREGEAIAYHIQNQILDYKNKTSRITFNAINKPEIMKAIDNPRDIDMDLVYAQFCRQVYDRYLGFKLSSFVKNIFNLKETTAGRVQSAALLLLAMREDEIKNYVPRYWWTIEPSIQLTNENLIQIKLCKNDLIENVEFETKELANEFYSKLNKTFLFEKIIADEQIIQKPNQPLTTSDVLTLASKEFKWSAKKTTQVLQKLYESGLITYPRTDSIRISPEFCQEAYDYVLNSFGDKYADNSFWFNNLKQKDSVQDGHECLRVSHLNLNEINEFKQNLSNDFKQDYWDLYGIIYSRTIQVFLKSAIFSKTTLLFNNNGYQFEHSFKTLVFDGFLKYTKANKKSEQDKTISIDLLNSLLNKEFVAIEKESIIEHHDSCPKKYSVGELIKKLEQLGIGRPSTFASMAEINLERGNAVLNQNEINLTEKGFKLNELIQKKVPEIINLKFTAEFEKELDQIASAKLNWNNIIKKYAQCYDTEISKFNNNELKEQYGFKPEIKVISKCLKCDGNIILKISKNGKQYHICENKKWDANTNSWIGCESNIVWLDDLTKKQALEKLPKCPKCDGHIMTKTTANGKKYKCCSNRKYDAATKTTSGCDYFEWINDSKKIESAKWTKN